MTRLCSIVIGLLTLISPAAAGELDDFLKAHEALGYSGAAIAVAFDADGGETVLLRGGYAYGWNVTAFEGRRLITHGGDTRGFATKYYRYPDDDVFVAWLSNNEVPEHMMAVNLARGAVGLSYPTPPLPFAIEPEALAAFAGTFSGDGGSVRISIEHGRATLLPLDAKLGTGGFTKNPRPGGVDWDAAGDRFVAAIVAGEPEGLKDIITDRFDVPAVSWGRRLVDWLHGGDKGALLDGTVIGTTVERGAPTTWLSLHYEQGDMLIGLIWEFGTDRVIGINDREAGGMLLHLVPRSETECILWNRRMNTQAGSLRREPADGPAATITIKRPDGETSYERAGAP